MTENTPVRPEVDARFKALAGAVDQEAWSQLITFTSDRLLRRLAVAGVFAEVSAEQMLDARNAVGEVLVEYTNAALTCVAEGELRETEA